MSTSHIDTIDKAVQTANIWVKELDTRIGWEDRQRSWRLLRETLHALRDWLSADEAVQLGAQLPMLVRGLYYEGWDPSKTPAKPRSLEDFVERVALAFETEPIEDLQDAISCVFDVLSWHVSKGEISDVKKSLPKALRDLWPED
jgi:uncharacterized protein (DUF2267 family)